MIDAAIIRNVIPDASRRLFLVSGPPGMVNSAKAALRSAGVHRSSIRTDYFPGYLSSEETGPENGVKANRWSRARATRDYFSRVRKDGFDKGNSEQIAELYRNESRRVLATLIRLLGDFDLAEESLQEAFQAALEQWPREGMPRNPRAWLVSAGRFKGIDALRRRGRGDALLGAVAEDYGEPTADPEGWDDETIQDDQLRLIFTCCHPSLPQDARIALALREVCGLTTEEVARAFLVPPQTMKKRIARAKERIRTERIPYEIPSRTELAKRLDAVLQVVYLVYNEGYAATAGEALIRRDLAEEALSLCRLLVDLLPEPEAIGLLALILLHESRRTARTDERRRRDPARTAGQVALGPGADSGGDRPRAPGPPVRPVRVLHPPGRHRGGSCRGTVGRGNGLGADRPPLRHAAGDRPLAGRGAQQGDRRGHA